MEKGIVRRRRPMLRSLFGLVPRSGLPAAPGVVGVRVTDE